MFTPPISEASTAGCSYGRGGWGGGKGGEGGGGRWRMCPHSWRLSHYWWCPPPSLSLPHICGCTTIRWLVNWSMWGQFLHTTRGLDLQQPACQLSTSLCQSIPEGEQQQAQDRYMYEGITWNWEMRKSKGSCVYKTLQKVANLLFINHHMHCHVWKIHIYAKWSDLLCSME